MTSHNWRELVSSGRLVCRCHDLFLWCYVCFVLLRFRLHAFVDAATLRSIVLRYAGAPVVTRVSFFFPFVYLEMSLFPSIFLYQLPFSLCMESTLYVLSYRMVLSYLVTTGWIFDISLCENSINQFDQSINKSAVNPSNANPACGHKEVRSSRGHIMVTARYSNQQGSKSRQNPCQVQPADNIGNILASRDDVFGTKYSFYCCI